MSFNVLDFGAVGDGKTLNTTAIASAIAAVKKTGGGELYFPAGIYRSGTISATDNLTIHLAPGAILYASGDLSDYLMEEPGKHQPCAFISAWEVENFTICGSGTIYGSGLSFWKTAEGDPVSWGTHPEEEIKSSLDLSNLFRAPPERPSLIRCFHCKNVKISDITLQDSACYTVWLLGCTNVKISGLTIRNHNRGPNTDGLDIDCCQQVMISNCNIETCDDAIALKSDCDRADVPDTFGVQDITVSNCILWSRCCGVRVGYEGNAPIRDCTFSNLVINHAKHALDIISVGSTLFPHITRGAKIERIRFSDITMRNVGTAFFLWAGNETGCSTHCGFIRNIDFFHIEGRTEETCFIGSDLPGKIDHLSFHQVHLEMKRKGESTSVLRDDRMPSVWGGSFGMGGLRLLRTGKIRMDHVSIFSDQDDHEVLVLEEAEIPEQINCLFIKSSN